MQPDQPGVSSLVFRVPTALDFAPLAEIRSDPQMQAMLMAIPQRTDDEAVREWIERRTDEPGGMLRAIAPSDGEPAVGFIQIGQVHFRNRHGHGAIAVSDRCTLPGVALIAMRELMRFARVELGLAKLLAEVRADNVLAIRMNTLLGYRIVGTLERHFVDHAQDRHDVVLLEKIF